MAEPPRSEIGLAKNSTSEIERVVLARGSIDPLLKVPMQCRVRAELKAGAVKSRCSPAVEVDSVGATQQASDDEWTDLSRKPAPCRRISVSRETLFDLRQRPPMTVGDL